MNYSGDGKSYQREICIARQGGILLNGCSGNFAEGTLLNEGGGKFVGGTLLNVCGGNFVGGTLPLDAVGNLPAANFDL